MEKFGNALAQGADDPHANPENAMESRTALLHFDALCLLDARYGTHEALRFFDEELARSQRILEAMRPKK